MDSAPGKQDAPASLWEKAFDSLPDEDKKSFKSNGSHTRLQPSEIVQVIEEKKKDCEKKQWAFYTTEEGERILVRDTLGKVCDWLNKFKEIGDAAVQFDPGYAALPWAAVRILLQMSVNDCQTFGNLIESIEAVSSIVARYTELEAKVLFRTSNLTKQLSAALVKLYGSALKFLAQAIQYYGQSTFKRLIKSTIHTSKSIVEEPMLSIEKQEDEVFKLVALVQDEVNGIRLDDIINRIQRSVESSHASSEERLKRLSAWINGINTQNTYETALQYHHSGTCEWAIELPEFRTWISNDDPEARLLWIHGPAGFGKTFLSAWMIRYLEQLKQAPLSYFFCVADNQLTRDPYAILRSWLTQMLEQSDRVMSVMNSVYKVRKQEQTLTHLGLWELFTSVGEAVEGCTFVIDGFDECIDIDTGARYHHNDPRNLFLCDLLKNLQKTKSRVMVVSRDVPDIREYLGQDVPSEGDTVKKLEYGITAKDTTRDVRSFSEYMVNKKLSKKKEELRQRIASQAAERSEGMFLWIKLLEQEISPGQNAKQLTRTVIEMPSGISDAYSRELEKIIRMPPDEKEKAVMILRWTLFAIRPLQVKQLAEALVVSEEDLDEYPEDDLPDSWNNGFVDEDYVKEMILGRCGSLLQLRASSSDVPLADHTVHFVHFSVKEYLSNLANHVATNRAAVELGLTDPVAEEKRLSYICLRYLTLNTFEDILPSTEVYPFLSYAAWAWYFHSFHEKPAPSQDIMHRTQKVFDPTTTSWRVWTPLMEAELADPEMDEWENVTSDGETDSKTDSESHDKSLLQVQNPIYYAALLGLIDVVKWLEDQGLEFGSAGGRFGFPLQAAVTRNHEDLVKYLLNRNVDVSQKGGQFGASIVAGAAMASPRIVQIILSAGADVTAVDESRYTALHHAVKRGNLEIVKLLLDYGGDVNAVAADNATAVSLACSYGHKDVLSVLAQKGADLTRDGRNAGTPLQAAIEEGDEGLVDVLLTNGVSANTVFPNGSCAITHAIQSLKLVVKLLKYGADPHMADKRGWAPLPLAVAYGNIDVLKVLVDAGASVDCEPNLNSSINCPLQVAVINNQLLAAKFLVEHGVDLNRKTKGGLTALIFAVRRQYKDMAEWLLDAGASIQGIFESNQQSLFDIAAQDSQPEIMRLLVRRGCFQIQTRGNHSDGVMSTKAREDNSLVILAYNGDIAGVRKLLSESSSPLPIQVLGEALHAASAQGHLPIVGFLLKNRTSASVVDINGRIALHHAAKHLHFDVADLLVEHGASITLEDMIGSTPIDLAIQSGQKAIEFIQNHMDDFTLNISRRPSLLAVTPNPSTNLTAMGARKAISGSWTGHYKYLSWQEGRRDPFTINIPASPPQGAQPSTFSDEGADVIGPFQFHGFVDSIGTVWFVKLYKELGWLYRGQVDPEKGILKGTWGSNRKLWFGTFQLESSLGLHIGLD
ncbi:ankyrin repeat and SOCS box protein 7 [Hypoxylon trugodes]|uniref:ankyrin repeat and SOCS box protein 7 n=1 Tax=Hypoxylon trugodes TaxID=326681 RepID=UPI00219EBA93|nr:ankyrin repeat and SOCS box protein 7 [Hypoxylon trugodes]KAI1389626.1 ankyrin repeat and SOCS box protein 7 [Hypoxylon trugodes]